MAGNYARHDYYECTGWTTDLKSRSTESGNKKAGDDRRVNACLRTNAGSDPKSHREWKSH
jgi:hypothetical protein